jgi:hypothetical protein
VARVAGVLAVAILGMVMVNAFSSRLNDSMEHQSLAPAIVKQVQANEINLAGLQVPAGVDPGTRTAIQQSIREAFVYAFRIVMFICVSLSLASVAVASHTIRTSKPEVLRLERPVRNSAEVSPDRN